MKFQGHPYSQKAGELDCPLTAVPLLLPWRCFITSGSFLWWLGSCWLCFACWPDVLSRCTALAISIHPSSCHLAVTLKTFMRDCELPVSAKLSHLPVSSCACSVCLHWCGANDARAPPTASPLRVCGSPSHDDARVDDLTRRTLWLVRGSARRWRCRRLAWHAEACAEGERWRADAWEPRHGCQRSRALHS